MIESKALAAAIREEIDNAPERVLMKQLAARLGYNRWSVSRALNKGRFTEPLLRRFAFLFPAIKRNHTFISIFTHESQ